MPKLWLTYAWKDNEDNDVDHVIRELRNAGVDVRFDRAELLAGERVWQQIDRAIADPTVDGLALFATKNSLESEPCQEELAYALDRVLRKSARPFKLIGIFPAPMDRTLIPSALATRLYVDLTDPTWKQQIVDSLQGHRSGPDLSTVEPYGMAWHSYDGKHVLEVWPRAGTWAPCVIAIPTAEAGLMTMVMQGPRGLITGSGMVQSSECGTQDGVWKGQSLNHAIDARQSAQAFFTARPSKVMFGAPSQLFEVRLSFGHVGPSAI